MKQCPNPNCIIYTRLDELPDTYLRCPRCDEPLVDSAGPTGFFSSAHLEEYTSFIPDEETTTPYVPVQPEYPRQPPVVYELPYDEYAEVQAPLPLVEPVPAQPAPSKVGLARTVALLAGALVLLVACGALAFALRSRLTPPAPAFNPAVATQTAVAWLRPPVNTPITLLPTIAPSVDDSQAAADAGVPPTVAPQPAPVSQAAVRSQPLAPAPVLDARMCARLDRGLPTGTTSAYKPADPFNLAVEAAFGPSGVAGVVTRWYGPGGGKIYEMSQSYARQGTYYAGFTVNKSSPWLPGNYRVDIYTNGSTQPVQSVAFTVIP